MRRVVILLGTFPQDKHGWSSAWRLDRQPARGLLRRAFRADKDFSCKEGDGLSEEQRRDILYNNAARLLRLSDAEIRRHHGR